MSDPRAFISFDIDHDEVQKNLFSGQAKSSITPFDIQDWSSKEKLPESQWQKLIKDKINKCNMLIVIVGKNMATATGVAKEIKFASECVVPAFGVYVSGANAFTTLPVGLPRYRVIEWKWDLIASKISQMMKEGKNK